MNIMRKVLRGFSVLAGVGAFLALFGFAYGVYHFHDAGLPNVSVICARMMIASMVGIILARFIWVGLAPVLRPLSPAPFCHVGAPL